MSSSSRRGTLARPGRSEVGFYHLRVLAHLGGRSLGDLLAVVENRHPVGDAHDHPHLALLASRAGEAQDRPYYAALQTRVHPGEHVLERAHIVEESDVLEGAANTHLRPPVRAVARDVAAQERKAS